ncbi:O-acetyl-ADP-ribose deacetylase [Dietzia alimentaria]|uniref:O-acetyl-ADP-ribose deacetylase n=1 Tax=Dietzia alimentaria TaxID=665550 RepID=UPI00029A673F|nr:O-acetyl-ADP-ribose deacetylase [Dietzia alimentaria]
MTTTRRPRIDLDHGDITRMRVDAVVNAANSSLLGGGGVDGAIHRAGGPTILAECRKLRADRLSEGLPTGQAVATGAGDLPARWVIHTVGPVYGRSPGDRPGAELLADCYRNSLAVADELGARSVAFPLISAGAYGWPREDAIRTALNTLAGTDTDVENATLVLFDADALRLAQSLLPR